MQKALLTAYKERFRDHCLVFIVAFVHIIFVALFSFRIGRSTLFTSLAPKYRRIIRYTLNGNMNPHVDNHHAIGAVSVVLQPGAEGNALYTCNDKDPLVEGEVSKVLIYYIIFPSYL